MKKLICLDFANVLAAVYFGVSCSYFGQYLGCIGWLALSAEYIISHKRRELLDETISLAKEATEGWQRSHDLISEIRSKLP